MGYNRRMEHRKKRSRPEKREGIQAVLEGYRRFDYDYIPFGTYTIPGADFKYRQKGFDAFVSGFIRGFLKVVAPLFLKIVYGCRVVGRSNLKAIGGKGAICVTNHISYLDTLFARAAIGQFRGFYTMAPWNNKRGVGGWIMRHGGMWPFSPNLTAMKNLMHEMDARLKEGKIVHFYAEQAMWVNYPKPRPMKDGAFYYAVKYKVPVLPVFFTFRRNRSGHMRRLRIHILPAVYADETLPRTARIAALKEGAEAAWRACYEGAYGVPLTYLPDRRKGSAAQACGQTAQNAQAAP